MIHKCLFPIAGYGTRFLPATKAMPKEMLPILNKPLLQYGVEEAFEANIKNMVMVTGRGKQAVMDHFDVSYELEHQIAGTNKEEALDSIRKLLADCTFSYTRQRQMKGLGHAIFSGRHLIGDMPFAVVLADDLCFVPEGSSGVLAQLIQLYETHKCSIVALAEVPPREVSKYGVIQGEALSDRLYRITDMVEKPAPQTAPSNLAIVGRYVLTPDLFEILEHTPAGRGGEIQITDALKTQALKQKVMGYRFQGRWFDCGSVPGLVGAINYYFQNHYVSPDS